MKIYEIGTGYTPIPAKISAATEIVVEELTKAFLKQNIPVEIVDIAADNRAEHCLPLREVKVPKCFSGTDVHLGIIHKLKRVVYSVALAGELKKILRQSEEKVVLHFHNQYNLFFFYKLTSKTLQKKAVIAYTNHSGIWRLPWQEIEETIKKRYFQEAVCMKKADIVFVLNQETKDNVKAHLCVPENRITLIGNGVNTDVYCPLTLEEIQCAKKKRGFDGKTVILQVGSVYENKGQLWAVEQLLPILEKNHSLVYAYAGGVVDSEYQNQIQDFVREHALEKQVVYLGMIAPGKDLNEFYNIARFTILPSKYESFGLVAIESCAAGVPVALEQNGPVKIGVGSAFYDSVNFKEDMEAWLSRDLAQLKEAARANAVNVYSWDKIANDYMVTFKSQ